MELDQGLTLDRYLNERGSLDSANVTRIGIQIAQQMSESASSFPVHPGRLLLAKGGVVRLLPPPVEDLALPTIIEFPLYASPEEIRGEKPDIRSSLYSLGCTLFELLCGAPPYAGKEPKKILHAHAEAPVPDVREHAIQVGEPLAETIGDLLEKDPARRPQSPREVIERLRQSTTARPAKKASGRTAARTARGGRLPSSPARRGAAGKRPPAPGARNRGGRRQAGPVTPARSAGPVSGKRSRVAGERRTRLSRTPQHPSRRARDLDDEFMDQEERRVLRRKKSYPLMITGGVLGLLVGILLVISRGKRAGEVPELEKEVVAEETAAHLKSRKDLFAAETRKKKEAVHKALARLTKLPEENRRDYLVEVLRNHCVSPDGHLLAKELSDMGPPPSVSSREGSSSGASGGAAEADYKAFLAEAQKLHDEGKLGPAYEKLADEESRFDDQHEDEITRLIEKWSDELTAKWEADQEKIASLSLDGKPDDAVALCRAAKEYGDSAIRKEADKLIASIREQTEFQKLAEKPEEKETDLGNEDTGSESGGKDPGAKDDDLESEFQKELEGAADGGNDEL